MRITRAVVPLPSDRDAALAELLAISEAMAGEGRSLVERVLPAPPKDFTQWSHYPEGDAIDPDSRARWFYHAHPPEERGPKEHGHFHMFLPLSAFAGMEPLAVPNKDGAARVVHVAALCFDTDGLPTHWIATNQWVTEEYLLPAEAIIARLDGIDMSQAGDAKGIVHVGRWLTCAMAACRDDIENLLRRRDEALAKTSPRGRDAEVLASLPFRL
ncbi:DUF6969 family protein [Erythrobacter alti]|uniref:DUF6969 family protein n=1 Tax=Erythrobacter alti TaxID=1896145 RepID=UPI0030F44CDA